MDNELKVKSLGSFSFDVTMFGTRREPNGRCWNAQAFEYDGKYYPSNYIVGRLKGQVTKRQIQFACVSLFHSSGKITYNSFFKIYLRNIH